MPHCEAPFEGVEKDQAAIQQDKITVSTVAAAKGFDAPYVMVASANEFRADIGGRASFSVACTRAREWLDVSCYEDSPIVSEFRRALAGRAEGDEAAAASKHPSTRSHDLSFKHPENAFDVWAHIERGLETASESLRALGAETEDGAAWYHFDARATMVLPEDFKPALDTAPETLEDPSLHLAFDIQVLRDVLPRAKGALERYRELPIVFVDGFWDFPGDYLREVVTTYTLGLDASCIALSGAAFEQLLRVALVQKNVLNEAGPQDRTPALGKMISLAERNGLLAEGNPEVKRLVDKRNRLMHRHIWDEKILRGMALASVNDLAAVLQHLDGVFRDGA